MTKIPFFNRLRDYYEQVNLALRGEASSASIFPNTTDIGISREAIYARFLKAHLPSNCNVHFGGFLFDFDGAESKQIDLIVTNDICPQFNFHNPDGGGKTFACVDGTLAVVSVKSNLSSSELIDSLDNILSIPAKQPLGRRAHPDLEVLGYDDWPFKVIFATKGASASTLLDTLNTYVTEKQVPVSKRPNLIHVSGGCCIVRVGPHGGQWGGKPLPPNSYNAIDISDSYGLQYAVSNIQQIADSSRHVIFDYGELLQCIPWRA
jgi:hypothetical protein